VYNHSQKKQELLKIIMKNFIIEIKGIRKGNYKINLGSLSDLLHKSGQSNIMINKYLSNLFAVPEIYVVNKT
jgi:hypothetical protein